MCVYSMVLEHGWEKWQPPTDFTYRLPWNGPTREEWEDFKELVIKAIEYDKRTNQPNCEDPKKVEWMNKMSEMYDKAKETVESR